MCVCALHRLRHFCCNGEGRALKQRVPRKCSPVLWGNISFDSWQTFIFQIYFPSRFYARKNGGIGATPDLWPVLCCQRQKHRKYRGFGFPRRKKHRYLGHILLRGFQKYARTPFIWWFFRGDKNAKTNCVATTTTRRKTKRKTNRKMRQQNTLPFSTLDKPISVFALQFPEASTEQCLEHAASKYVVRWLRPVVWQKPGYGAGRSAALSAFLNVDNLCGSHVPLDISVILDHCGPSLRTTRKNGSIREHQVTWWRCYNVSKTSCKFLAEDVTTYQECVGSNLKNMLQRIMRILQKIHDKKMPVPKRRTWKKINHCYNESGTYCKYLEENVATYQKRLANYLPEMLQRIKNVRAVAWRICYNVSWGFCKRYMTKKCQYQKDVLEKKSNHCYNESGTYCKYLEENVTTYQKRLANYLPEMLQRIKNVWAVAWRICYNVSWGFCKRYMTKKCQYQKDVLEKNKPLLQRIRNVLQVSWRKCCNVSKTSGKLLAGDVTTYQECVGSSLKNMLQRIMRILQKIHDKKMPVPKRRTWKKINHCYNESGTYCKYLEENVATYQKRLANYLPKMLLRIKNVWAVTWRICYNVSWGFCKRYMTKKTSTKKTYLKKN